MRLDARQPEKPAGVVVDHGTGKRIPFVVWCDFDTGEYEANVPAANGVDVIVDPYTRNPLMRRGRAVGKLELLPMSSAAKLGDAVAPPKKVVQTIQPMTKDEKIEGMRQYQQLFVKVWCDMRGEARRNVDDRWLELLRDSPFLDDFCLKRKHRTN